MSGEPSSPPDARSADEVEAADPVLHIAAPAAVGGLERVVQGLATGQHARGWATHVAAVVESPDHPFLKPLHHAGVPTHLLLAEKGRYLQERRFVRRILHQVEPRVVHTHGYRPDLLDAPLARRRGIATVTTEHGSSKMGGTSAIYEWIQARKRKDFDAVVAVSSAIASRLARKEAVPQDRIHLIPNCWPDNVRFLARAEARERLGMDGGEPVIGWVGRMIRAKGPDVMAKAVPRMGPRGSAVFIGDGPLMPSVQKVLEASDTRGRARLVGYLDNAAPLFPAFDIFALSSRTEGTPIVILEAMAAEIPIVAARVGGITDMLSPREAVLVPPEDPTALGKALAKAIANPEEMRERADRAKARLLDEFSAEAWLDRHERAYRHALRIADRRG